jgi:gamma-glutamylcyclotransferase (GGCT)/AIG2-like uncharacterized protein YtfP
MKQRTQKLFVYGTLRRGFALHSRLARLDARYLGKGRIAGNLYNLGEYPGAVPSRSRGKAVEGEVYELQDPEKQLKTLDRAEEFNPAVPERSLFIRQKATVRLTGGRRVRAWVYFLPRRPSKARILSSGDFAEARRVHR